MKKIFVVLFLFVGHASSVWSQSVTFSEHIAPIIYKHCTTCHRPGEVGPFPLTNYAEVSAFASTIQYVTQIGYMPPWKPDPTYQRYQKENFLTDQQKQLISDWVNQGSVEGNPDLAPVLPTFPNGSQVGVPDLVLSFAQKHIISSNNNDEYRFFVLPTGLTQDVKIKALEFRPGNKRLVHHALIWEDTTGQALAADLATPQYGFTNNQGSSMSFDQQQLPGYVPGAAPVVYSNGITQRLHAGSDLKIQVHYAPSSVDETDSSVVNVFFENNGANRILTSFTMVPIPGIIQNGPFVIPANQTIEFHGKITVPFDVSLYSVSPHCHLLGTHWKVYAVKPNNDTIPIINIKEWDFNWQGSYLMKQLIKITAGSVLHAYAGYDNTANNINNPNNPPQIVTWGEGTSDEMFYLPLGYFIYQQGDENIVFEDQPVGVSEIPIESDKLYPIAPTPTRGNVTFGFTLSKSANITIQLLNLQGSRLKMIENNAAHFPGYHTREIDLSDLANGIYLLEWSNGKQKQVEKIVLAR